MSVQNTTIFIYSKTVLNIVLVLYVSSLPRRFAEINYVQSAIKDRKPNAKDATNHHIKMSLEHLLFNITLKINLKCHLRMYEKLFQTRTLSEYLTHYLNSSVINILGYQTDIH